MLIVFALLFIGLIGLFIWTARTSRHERPIVPAALPGHYGALLEGARRRGAHTATVLTAREQARRVTGLGESVQVEIRP